MHGLATHRSRIPHVTGGPAQRAADRQNIRRQRQAITVSGRVARALTRSIRPRPDSFVAIQRESPCSLGSGSQLERSGLRCAHRHRRDRGVAGESSRPGGDTRAVLGLPERRRERQCLGHRRHRRCGAGDARVRRRRPDDRAAELHQRQLRASRPDWRRRACASTSARAPNRPSSATARSCSASLFLVVLGVIALPRDVGPHSGAREQIARSGRQHGGR